MGMNQLWRTPLLNASRSLRQNVVQGRIWGFGSALPEEEEEELSQPSSPSKHMSLPATIAPINFNDFDLDSLSQSTSSHVTQETSEADVEDADRRRGPSSHARTSSGRVKGLVANFERSSSSASSSMEEEEDPALAPTGSAFQRLGSDSVDASPAVNNDVALEYDPRSLEADTYGSASIEAASDMVTTSGSEGEDEREDDDKEELVGVHQPTPSDASSHSEATTATTTSLETDEGVSPSSSSFTSPAVPPQTPPPSYAATRVAHVDSILHLGDEDGHSSTTAQNTPSPKIILTANTLNRRNLSYIAELSFELPTDDKTGVDGHAQEEQTISELLANIDPSGANAWLEREEDDDGVVGAGGTARTTTIATSPGGTGGRRSTAKQVFESVRSISRKANRPSAPASADGSLSFSFGTGRSKGSAATRSGGGRAGLIGLFDPIPPPPPAAEARTEGEDEEREEAVEEAGSQRGTQDDGRNELLLEVFRARLEEVEKRLEEMEIRDAEKEAASQAGSSQELVASGSNLSRVQELLAGSSSSPADGGSVVIVEQMHSMITRQKDDKKFDELELMDEDPPLAALPSYVLLVGLGVCSLVMRVVFKRIVDKIY